MHSLWRFVLVWLMALAIPVQGVAAAGMLHCDASPAQPQQGAAHAHVHAGHSHAGDVHAGDAHAGDAHAGGAHAGGAHAGDAHASDAQGAAAADDPADDTNAFGHKCSACAACCAGLAIPAQAAEFSSPIVASFAALPPGAAPAFFVLGRLDRPPRPTLA